MPEFKIGDRVQLPAIPEEGFPEEFGVVADNPKTGVLVVLLDQQYRGWRDDEYDDGLREVAVTQVELV